MATCSSPSCRPAARPLALLLALLVLTGAALPRAACAQAMGSDARAKARLVVTFSRFVQWPAHAFAHEDSPLLLCVAQDSPVLADAFRRQLATPPAGRPLQLVWWPTPAPPGPAPDGNGCHLLYIDDSAPRRLADLLPPPEAPVLTMAQQDGFASRGGMVEVVVVNDALRFDVNLTALQKAELGVRAGVLKLAREVLREEFRR